MKILHILIISGLIFTGSSFAINDAYAAGFIKFDGIEGESIDKDHNGWSDLLSFSESSTNKKDSSTARVTGETTLQDIVIVKELDKSSPKLAESILMGKVFPKVEIHLKSNAKTTYYAYELKNVIVTNYFISGDENDRPTEEISLSFEELVYTSISDQEIQGDENIDKSIQETTKVETSMKSDLKVPAWVQTTAKFWVDKNVSDREFTDALGFLVKEKIIEVEVEPELVETDQPDGDKSQVPAWIATTTEWWINGEVPEDQFLEGIKWMIKNKIITGV